MPLFEVSFPGGKTEIMQAHNKRQLREALGNVKFTAIKKNRCRSCKDAVADVQGTFCTPCWKNTLTQFEGFRKDIPMTGQEFESLVMSFFVTR